MRKQRNKKDIRHVGKSKVADATPTLSIIASNANGKKHSNRKAQTGRIDAKT